MNHNLLVMVLIGVILTLLLPLTESFHSNEPAFTADNLVRIDLIAK